jgi:hypothetical protein
LVFFEAKKQFFRLCRFEAKFWETKAKRKRTKRKKAKHILFHGVKNHQIPDPQHLAPNGSGSAALEYKQRKENCSLVFA